MLKYCLHQIKGKVSVWGFILRNCNWTTWWWPEHVVEYRGDDKSLARPD